MAQDARFRAESLQVFQVHIDTRQAHRLHELLRGKMAIGIVVHKLKQLLQLEPLRLYGPFLRDDGSWWLLGP